MQVGPAYAPITSEYLDYQEVMHKYDQMLDWLAGIYVNILNLIHYMHDKYYYESAEMALIDTDVRRTLPPESPVSPTWSILSPRSGMQK